MRRFCLGSVAVLIALAFPPSASGATTVGQTAPSAAAALLCGGATLFLSPQVATGTPSYVLPAGGGVITSWSVQGGGSDGQLELKVVRPVAANTYRVVGEDPMRRAIPAGTLASFDARIPASAGDMLALWVPEGLSTCQYDGQAGDVLAYRAGVGIVEPGISEDFVANKALPTPPRRANVSATLEPDGDSDGFGDETQDGCPKRAVRQDDCVPPGTEITKSPPNKTDKPKAKYRFSADEPDATFECKLKGKGLKKSVKQFGDCDSPRKYRRLDEGKYKFKVRAIDAADNVDPSPAKDKFRVVG